MKFKALTILLPVLLLLAGSAAVFAHEGRSDNSGSGGGGDENRIRVEARANEDEPGEDRVRVEIRGEGATVENAINLLNQQNLPDEIGRVRIDQRDDRVRVEVRAPEAEEVEEAETPGVEIEGNEFEITGEVTAFTGGTVTVAGQTITIDPNQVATFEQEGAIEIGEVIKVEGSVQDGTLVAREVKANGVEAEVEDEVEEANVGGNPLMGLLNQVLAFLQGLV